MSEHASSFVLGATGFVGREVVRQLCVRDARVIAHVRPDSRELERWRTSFGAQGAVLDTTAWHAAALAERLATAHASVVYILIGTTRAKAKADHVDGNIYETIDYGLTAIAAQAATAAGKGARLVYLSSVGANSQSSSAYLKWRGEAERAVIESGLDYVIARPSVITGERDERRLGERASAVIADGLLGVVRVFGGKGLRDKYGSTTPDVLAAALIRHGEEPGHPHAIVAGSELR